MKQESSTQKKTINLKKAKSLLEKIILMVEKGDYCIDIMQQNLAVIGMLKSFHEMMMADHLSSCFKKAMESGSDKKKKAMIEEILRVNNFYNR